MCDQSFVLSSRSLPPREDHTSSSLADGCYHVFLDLGSNRGVHGRFFFEPELYPGSTVVPIFDDIFGKDRKTSHSCVFAFEPNPYHIKNQRAIEKAYNLMGWRYHFMPFGVSHSNGTLNFYSNADAKSGTNDASVEFWGFSTQNMRPGDSKNIATKIPVVDFPDWVLGNLITRKLPNYLGEKPPSVVMKMDVEGAELPILAKLLTNGALCQFDKVFMELHPYPVALPHWSLNSTQIRPFFQSLNDVLRGAACKSILVLHDSEQYLHDGKPLPVPGDANTNTLRIPVNPCPPNFTFEPHYTDNMHGDICRSVTGWVCPKCCIKQKTAPWCSDVPAIQQGGIRKPCRAGIRDNVSACTAPVLPELMLCVLVTLRYESPYLLPWLTYHRLLGSAHIWVYLEESLPNSSITEHAWILRAMQQQSWITVVRMQEHRLVTQGGMASHCIQETFGKARWVGFWDVDEVMVAGAMVPNSGRKDMPVPSIVEHLKKIPKDAEIIMVPRISFLSGGIIDPSATDQMQAFTHRACTSEATSIGRTPGKHLLRANVDGNVHVYSQGHCSKGDNIQALDFVRNPDGSRLDIQQLVLNSSGTLQLGCAITQTAGWPSKQLPADDPRMVLRLHHYMTRSNAECRLKELDGLNKMPAFGSNVIWRSRSPVNTSACKTWEKICTIQDQTLCQYSDSVREEAVFLATRILFVT
jgi:FkbM family methyltransferase